MPDSGQLLGDWIEERLREMGWTRAMLHRETGVARSTIDALIAGERQADLNTYRKLAEALGPVPPPSLRQVVGGPRIPADAQTPRQALSMAKRAIDRAERLLEPVPTGHEEPSPGNTL